MLSGVGLVGRNPTMNIPRLLKGGEDSFFKFMFTCSGTSIVYFICDSASELERRALHPFCGFPALICNLP